MKSFMTLFRTEDGKTHLFTFALVCCLFGISGLCNGMIDVLNRHFKDTLGLSDSQSALVQGAWYGAYFLMAFPAGYVARRLGYRGGILTGLAIIAGGALLFIPVTGMSGGAGGIYAAFLGALFAVGAGFTFLETVANPYATVLGGPDGGASRINLAQSFNAIGWVIGPVLGGKFTLASGGSGNATLYIPYLIVACVVIVLFFVFALSPVPNLQPPEEKPGSGGAPGRMLRREHHFTSGLVAQFLYVAGQCAIFAFFITYILDPAVSPALPGWLVEKLPADMCRAVGGHWYITKGCSPYLLSAAFVLFAVGRFSGSLIQRYFRPEGVLGAYGLANVALMLLVIANLGWVSVIALMVAFFFMSIMYPTIFALSIRGLGPNTKRAAAFLVATIVGGAIAPYLMGRVIDRSGMSVSFVIPAACFAYIAFYGMAWRRLHARGAEDDPSSPPAMLGH
ncbi:MAG: sugar MFS transporter [Verrucomicrobia bacterium]|nr:sugar MFS transporter [Verrucomicrobiota bacterium]